MREFATTKGLATAGFLAMAIAMAGCGGVDYPQLSPQAAASARVTAAEASAARRMGGPGYQVVRTVPARDWDRIECLQDGYPDFPTEKMRPGGRQTDPDIVSAFGTDMPPSKDVLLHYARGWNTGKGTPVLLVHGALEDASSEWLQPHGYPGLVPELTSKGYRVFAVTFAHRNGDNELQAEAINNALDRIEQVTGARQVDVISHSKGTVAARALVSGVRLPWMAPYRHDIRRLILIGSPNLGIDYSFRHPIVNWGLYPEKDEALFNAPMSWTQILYLGLWQNTTDQSFMGDYFLGQDQMLARFDKDFPLPTDEPDWYTTYHGGQGFVSVSEGIDKAIAKGKDFIQTLRDHPVDPQVQLAVLAGDHADLTTAFNENSGPSDGVVFVKSATYTQDLTRGGARLLDMQILPLNHMQLIYAPAAKAWIEGILGQPEGTPTVTGG